MTNYPSTPLAYWSANAWDDHSRDHPVFAWFERYTKEFFDQRLYMTDAQHIKHWHTSDFTFVNPDGVPHSGVDKAFEVVRETFGPFKAHLHSAKNGCMVPLDGEGKQGEKRWLLLAYADAYFDFAGDAKGVGKKVKSPDGKEWDYKAPSAYKFFFVEGTEEGNGGIALSRTEVFTDTHPLMAMVAEMQGGK